jgi:hypothetical protein
VSTREPYIYANANPIGLSDPSGLCSSERACETAIRQCENGGGGVWDGKSGTCGSRPGPPKPGSGGPGSDTKFNVCSVRGAEFNPSCWTADERAAAACIFDPACGATDLVAAIKAAPAFLRDTIIGSIDVAQYGDVGNEDGNWSSQDVEAAANAENLIAMGADPATAALIASVAGRLVGHGDQWETLDAKEKSWIERKGLTALTIGLGVVGLFACTVCAVAAWTSVGLSTYSAATTCAAEGVSANGVASASLTVLSAGTTALASKGGQIIKAGRVLHAGHSVKGVGTIAKGYGLRYSANLVSLSGTVASLNLAVCPPDEVRPSQGCQ